MYENQLYLSNFKKGFIFKQLLLMKILDHMLLFQMYVSTLSIY